MDAWQLWTWESCRDVTRLGRKTRLPEKSRAALWGVVEGVRARLQARGLMTLAEMYRKLTETMSVGGKPLFYSIVVDEAQDVSIPQLRLLAALAGTGSNSLLLAGDLGQRIFQQPFSWKELGIEIRGRSTTLKINYRTSHQIRKQADRLLGPAVSDVDGNTEERRGTISVFNGDPPIVEVLKTGEAETQAVAKWLKDLVAERLQSEEIAIFVRSENELPRAEAAVRAAGLACKLLDESMDVSPGLVSIGTMHAAKGMEFRAVAVMACDGEVIPSPERIAC